MPINMFAKPNPPARKRRKGKSPRLRKIRLSLLASEAGEVPDSADLSPQDYRDLDPIIYERIQGVVTIVDGYHRAGGLMNWAVGNGKNPKTILIDAIDVSGYDPDVVSAAADGLAGERQELALGIILRDAIRIRG